MKFLKHFIWLGAALVFCLAFGGVASASDNPAARTPFSSVRAVAFNWDANASRSGATLATAPHDDSTDSGDDDGDDDDSSED